MFRRMLSNSHGRRISARRRNRTMLRHEPLECRRLLTATAGFSAGGLLVSGDSGANNVTVTYDNVMGTNYLIVTDGVTEIFNGRPNASNVTVNSLVNITAEMGDGDDTIDCGDVSPSNGFAATGLILIEGEVGNDLMIGTDFDDFFAGDVGDDSIYGNAGVDQIPGNEGDDLLVGGPGNDKYIFARLTAVDLGSDDIVEGTGGSNDEEDTLVFGYQTGGATIDLSDTGWQDAANGDLFIRLNANDAFEFVIGTDNNDDLIGNTRTNLLEGGAGDDTLAGGDGDDVYLYRGTGLGSDVINEAANDDRDFLDFSGFGASVDLNLSNTSAQMINFGNLTLTLSNDTAIEAVGGSSTFSNFITGNDRGNIIFAFGGSDILSGGVGNDILIGGDGADNLNGGDDDDILISGDWGPNATTLLEFITGVNAVMDEWESMNSFADRIDNIKGTGGSPIPANYRMTPGVTVFDLDNDVDTLDGGSDNDWAMFDFGEDTNSNTEQDDDIG